MCYTWAPPGARINYRYTNRAESQGQQPSPFDSTAIPQTPRLSIVTPAELSNTSQPAFSHVHQTRLGEIYTIIKQSLSSHPPTSSASQILAPSVLPLYTAAGSILQAGLTSTPVIALNKYALAEAVEACIPSPSDLTNPDPSPKPKGYGVVNENAILEAKKRAIEFFFRETERLGTTEMIEVADYIRRIGGQCAGILVCEDEEDDEDGDEKDPDSNPGTVKAWNECIKHGDTPEVAIRKLVAYTANAATVINSSRSLNKGQFVATIESMRNETLQQLSTPNPNLDQVLNILLLVKQLGDWNPTNPDANIDGLATDSSKSDLHKLKLVDLLYGAAKSLSNAEMQDFLDRAVHLMSGIEVDSAMVIPDD
jgi:nitrate reductase NapAB chaperone NapD